MSLIYDKPDLTAKNKALALQQILFEVFMAAFIVGWLLVICLVWLPFMTFWFVGGSHDDAVDDDDGYLF